MVIANVIVIFTHLYVCKLFTIYSFSADFFPQTLVLCEHHMKQFDTSHLSEEQKKILIKKGTEAPFTGEYVNNHEDGMYHCAWCDAPLFSSDTKFDSGSGWPSFWESVDPNKVTLKDDNSLGMHRVEVECSNCHGHLGHLFEDGPRDQTGLRFCINSCALQFKKQA